MRPRGRGGGGLLPDMAPLDRVWFFASPSYQRVYNFTRICPYYKQGIACTTDLICQMKFVCAPSIKSTIHQQDIKISLSQSYIFLKKCQFHTCRQRTIRCTYLVLAKQCKVPPVSIPVPRPRDRSFPGVHHLGCLYRLIHRDPTQNRRQSIYENEKVHVIVM